MWKRKNVSEQNEDNDQSRIVKEFELIKAPPLGTDQIDLIMFLLNIFMLRISKAMKKITS